MSLGISKLASPTCVECTPAVGAPYLIMCMRYFRFELHVFLKTNRPFVVIQRVIFQSLEYGTHSVGYILLRPLDFHASHLPYSGVMSWRRKQNLMGPLSALFVCKF
jgi:hypothetical protein